MKKEEIQEEGTQSEGMMEGEHADLHLIMLVQYIYVQGP